MELFLSLVDMCYEVNKSEFPLISKSDLHAFKNRMEECDKGDVDGCQLYDPIMSPLVQFSLSHLLYMKKMRIEQPNITAFHPNYLKFYFFDKLIYSKSDVTFGAFKLLEITPGAASIDQKLLMIKVDDLIQNPTLRAMIYIFVCQLQVDKDKDPLEKVLGYLKNKRQTTGLIYFILIDLYLEHLDKVVLDIIQKGGQKCIWVRCLNTALLCFPDLNRSSNDLLQMDIVLPAWGLTAKATSVNRGGRIIRPWRGKLYINCEGHLQWCRPESIIEI